MKSHFSLALLCLLAAQAAFGHRQLQQALDTSVVPQNQGLPLTIVNANDPSATQTAPPTPASPSPPPVLPSPVTLAPAATAPVSTPIPVVQTPATVPATAPTVPPPAPLPTATAPAPVPAVVAPPNVTAPAPAPTKPVAVPAVAPSNVTAPAPAPKAAAPAPVPVPAPAPGPQSPPQCGVQPQCRVFVEDMLCCENAGAITNKQSLVYQLQCTHPVNYYPQCARLRGPTVVASFTQFQRNVWSTSHTVQVNFLSNYTGSAALDIESPRSDGNLAADCGLYISPCLYNNTLVTKVAPVLGLNFTALDAADFLDVSEFLNYDLNNLDSLVFPNLNSPSTCQQQNIASLNATFYESSWLNYTSGFQNACNATAYSLAVPVASGTVSTASISG